MLVMLLRSWYSYRRQLSRPDHDTAAERAHACVEMLGKQSVLGTTFRLILTMAPWPIYQSMASCWSCFDFEVTVYECSDSVAADAIYSDIWRSLD